MTLDGGFNGFLAAQPVISHKTETALTASADQNTSTSAIKTNTAFYTLQTMIVIINTFNTYRMKWIWGFGISYIDVALMDYISDLAV
jgi:hypothetical protein